MIVSINNTNPATITYNNTNNATTNNDPCYCRWRCHDLSGGYLQYAPEKVVKFIEATAILHNICRMANLPDPDNIPLAEDEEGEEDRHGGAQPGLNIRNNLIQTHFSR